MDWIICCSRWGMVPVSLSMHTATTMSIELLASSACLVM